MGPTVCPKCGRDTYLLEDDDGAPYMPDLPTCEGCDLNWEECTCDPMPVFT